MTTIRHGGPCGLRIEMRSDERGPKTVGFRVTNDRRYFVTRSEGGWNTIFGLGLPQPHSSICLIPLWLSPVNRPAMSHEKKKAGTRATPPQKNRGVMRTRIAGIWNMPLSRSPWGRSRPHLSLREGLEQPPGGGAKSPVSPIPSTAAPPFPSRFIVSDRSSPSRVRCAASRPGRLAGRSERRAAYEGRGGGSGRGVRGRVASPLAHDKGYYHSYISRSSCRGSDSNGAKSHVKGRSWDRLASQNLGRPRSCDSFSVQRQVKGPQDLGCGVEVNGTALVLTRPHLHTYK